MMPIIFKRTLLMLNGPLLMRMEDPVYEDFPYEDPSYVGFPYEDPSYWGLSL